MEGSNMENQEASRNDSAAGFGEMIRSARQSREMSLAELSMTTNIMLDKLHALEEGRLEDLPEPVYVRAFIRAVAKALEVDPAPIIERFTAEAGVAGDIVHQIPDRNPSEEAPLGDPQTMNKLKMLVFVVLAAAAGAAVWYVYSGEVESKKAEAQAQLMEEKLSNLPSIEEIEGEVNPSSSGDRQTSEAPQASVDPALKPGEVPNISALIDDDLHEVVVTVSQPCWIQVTSIDGKRVLAKEMKKDESQTLSLKKGARFTIGNTKAASIVVDGSAYDYSSAVRNGVARFILQ